MKTNLFITLLALCPLLWSQALPTTEQNHQERIIKVVRVHGDAEHIAALAGGGLGCCATVMGSNKLGVVVIKGTPAEVENLPRIVGELDSASPTVNTSSKDVEVVVYLVAGSMNPTDSSADPGAALLAPVYKQLRTVFPYVHYRLANTVLMRSGQNSRTSTSGTMKQLSSASGERFPSKYEVSFDAVTASAGTPATVRIVKFTFDAEISVETGSTVSKIFQQLPVKVQTNVDLHEGEKVVIGTSNLESSEATLFLVVSAKIVE